MIRTGTLQHRTLVTTVMSNVGLDRAIAERGGRLVRTPVGDRYVVEEMLRGGFNLGGEQSGHIVFLDQSTSGDGLLTALYVLARLVETGRPLSELRRVMRRFPQVLLNSKVRERRPWEEMPGVARAIRAAESELGTDGRVLVRYSGTEALARIMVEGENEDVIRRLAESILGEIRTEIGAA
jgi:phosphoglucosamine mutase